MAQGKLHVQFYANVGLASGLQNSQNAYIQTHTPTNFTILHVMQSKHRVKDRKRAAISVTVSLSISKSAHSYLVGRSLGGHGWKRDLD